MKPLHFVIINGPNLNLLGIREPSVYGAQSYADLCHMIREHANALGVSVSIFQSNHEGDLIDWIQEATKADGIIINPAAYTHTSIALLDALRAVGVPAVEVHISDVSKREEYRQISYIREYCLTTIAGRGLQGYLDAMDYLLSAGEAAL